MLGVERQPELMTEAGKSLPRKDGEHISRNWSLRLSLQSLRSNKQLLTRTVGGQGSSTL